MEIYRRRDPDPTAAGHAVDRMQANKYILFLAYASPFAGIMLYDYFLMEKWFYLVSNDSVIGWYSLGLNWLTLTPRPTFWHPGYWFQELAAVLALAAGVAPEDASLTAFFHFGILAHLAFLAIAGLWMARLALRHRLGAGLVLAVAAVSATMPTMLAFSTHYADYYMLGVLMPPMAVAFYSLFAGPEIDRPTASGAFFVLGFAAANYFLWLVTVLAVMAVLGWALARHSPPQLERLLAGSLGEARRRRRERLWWVAAYVCVSLAAVAPLYLLCDRLLGLSSLAVPAALVLGLLAGLSAAAGLQALLATRPALRVVAIHAAGPLLWGWLVGTNVMAPLYLFSALKLPKQGAGPDWQGFVAFFQERYWHWLLLACFGVVLWMLAARLLRRRPLARDELFVVIFAGGGLALNFLTGEGRAASYVAGPPDDFGLSSRFFLIGIPVVATVMIWLDRRLRRGSLRAAVVSGLLLVAALSAAEYSRTLHPVTEERRAVSDRLDRITEDYLAAHPDGKVLCARDETSKACYVGYAFNRYRTGRSLEKWPTSWLYEGRVRYISTAELGEDLSTLAGPNVATALLIGRPERIAEMGDPVLASRQIVFLERGIEASVVRLD